MPKGQAWCGETVGILVLDESIPRVPGSVLNARTFDFPVRYRRIKGAYVDRLLRNKDPELLKPFIDAALELQSDGVGSIAGSCGFMALFQKEIADAVDVPVAMSSLVQLPLLFRMFPPRRKIGIITASKESLTPQVLLGTGITEEEITSRLVISGLDGCPEAEGAFFEQKGSLDTEVFRAEVLGALNKLMDSGETLGAILMECSEMPPYSQDVYKLSGLPVFDFVTMIRFCAMGVSVHSWDF